MSNLMIKNGYNGSYRRYGKRISKATRHESACNFKRSIRFPTIMNNQDSEFTQIAPQGRFVSNSSDDCGPEHDYYSDFPSLNRDDTDDCIILLQDEVNELRHLAVTLGIDTQRKNGDVLVREVNRRWSPVKQSRGEEWWKNSKKWIKHNEEEMHTGHMYDSCKSANVTQMKREKKLDKESELSETENEQRDKELYEHLPEDIKRKVRSVMIPGIGCSYRLPVINRKQTK